MPQEHEAPHNIWQNHHDKNTLPAKIHLHSSSYSKSEYNKTNHDWRRVGNLSEVELQPHGGQEHKVLPQGRTLTQDAEAGSILAVGENVLADEVGGW